jgi:hypothetical protein
LLGSLLTTQFQLGAMARATRPETERLDFYLFIDEFQNFSTDSFASILAEARKYRLSLVLSHQYLDQLSTAVRKAVFGNVGTLIAFRTGFSDAELLENEFARAFPASAISDLERFEAVVRLHENGASLTPFRAQMLSPTEFHYGNRPQLIARSRERFSSPRSVVEAKLGRWMRTGRTGSEGKQ